jgi:hypothetical protein
VDVVWKTGSQIIPYLENFKSTLVVIRSTWQENMKRNANGGFQFSRPTGLALWLYTKWLLKTPIILYEKRNQAHLQELIKNHMTVISAADVRPSTAASSVVMLNKFQFVCGFGDRRIVKTKGRDVMLYHANYAKGSEDKLAKLAMLNLLFLEKATAGKGAAAQPPQRYSCKLQPQQAEAEIPN